MLRARNDKSVAQKKQELERNISFQFLNTSFARRLLLRVVGQHIARGESLQNGARRLISLVVTPHAVEQLKAHEREQEHGENTRDQKNSRDQSPFSRRGHANGRFDR